MRNLHSVSVLFLSLDRFSREAVLETLKLSISQRLTSYGVAFKSFTENSWTAQACFRDAVISILVTIAKQERVRLSEARHCWSGACDGKESHWRPPVRRAAGRNDGNKAFAIENGCE